MMQIGLRRSWKDEFALAARQGEIRHRERKAFFAEQERQRRKDDKLDDERQDAETLMAVETILASSEEIAAFRVELAMYDAATIEALMDNQDALDAVRRKKEAMLAEAHVLPDGRRVFKTKDGLHVFDEHGEELSADVIDPDSIADHNPKWEPFKSARDEEARLMEERRQLLAYQEKLDAAHERLDAGEITREELEEVKADLAEAMPEAVRIKLGLEQPKAGQLTAEATPESDVAASALPSNMDNLMRQTGLAPAPL